MFLTNTSPAGDPSWGTSCEKWGDPHKETTVRVASPQMGKYTLTVELVQDKHGRKFPQRVTQVEVSVQWEQGSPGPPPKP